MDISPLPRSTALTGSCHTIEQATRTRRYITTASPEAAEDASGRGMGYPVAHGRGPAMVAAPCQLGRPAAMCIIDEPDDARREAHIGIAEDSARTAGHNNAPGGMTGVLFGARGIRNRLAEVEVEPRRIDSRIAGVG